ncbi:MAG: Gldg family protein, partial [Oligoflexia bacterium]|nr:Gldg family protein [Oligoflexia bacterium]
SQSRAVLRQIPSALNFKLFLRRSDYALYVPLLELYRLGAPSTAPISIEVIDPDLQPTILQKYEITQYGCMVIEGKSGQGIIVKEINESNITKALMKITHPTPNYIYFLSGHNEANFAATTPEGFSVLKKAMEKELYQLQELRLSATHLSIIPPHSVLLLWGPRLPLLPEEITQLEKFLVGGGKILMALDPDFKNWPHQGLAESFRRWGIVFNNNIALDFRSHVNGSQGTVPIINKYSADHPITKNFSAQTFFPLSSSFSTESAPEVIKRMEVTPLLFTNEYPHSWAENNLQEIVSLKPVFNPQSDERGPLNLAMASTTRNWTTRTSADRTKIVAFGNSTFVTNVYAQFTANYNLFLNALAWLSDDIFLATADRPELVNQPTFISGPQLGIIFYFTLIVAPLLLIAVAIYFYIRRKKL